MPEGLCALANDRRDETLKRRSFLISSPRSFSELSPFWILTFDKAYSAFTMLAIAGHQKPNSPFEIQISNILALKEAHQMITVAAILDRFPSRRCFNSVPWTI